MHYCLIIGNLSDVLSITLDDVAHARYAAHMGHASSCAVHIGGALPRPCLQALMIAVLVCPSHRTFGSDCKSVMNGYRDEQVD